MARKKEPKKQAKKPAKKAIRPAKKTVQKKLITKRAKTVKTKKIIKKVVKAKQKKKISKNFKPVQTRVVKDLDAKNKYLKKILLQKREEILKEIKQETSKYIKGENRQLVDTALDDGDWSVVDISEDISLRQLSAQREKLLKIDESLRKLDEGSYGICEICGEGISEQRLKVLPFAINCRDCQEKIEELEAIEKASPLT
ncbi:MAG: TraR/DksA C4-type zinc finger protein [Nitrospiraceae bacterium]|nr:TraR/DksA C4-type zinc finger protein [Nitrospiraceae bacterium]